jgi:hypothetical protein
MVTESGTLTGVPLGGSRTVLKEKRRLAIRASWPHFSHLTASPAISSPFGEF